VALLPAYAKTFLPSSVATRPLRGFTPKIDLSVGYREANDSPVLKLFLSRIKEHAMYRGTLPPSNGKHLTDEQ
jgi:LysR family transcriptional regulator, hca operon transcriptional activator